MKGHLRAWAAALAVATAGCDAEDPTRDLERRDASADVEPSDAGVGDVAPEDGGGPPDLGSDAGASSVVCGESERDSARTQEDIDALAGCTVFIGNIFISSPWDLSALRDLRHVHWLFLNDGFDPRELRHLRQLESAETVQLASENLETLEGLKGLRHVDRELNISSTRLTDIQLPALETVDHLRIRQNGELVRLGGLTSLRKANALFFLGNPRLSPEEIQALTARVEHALVVVRDE